MSAITVRWILRVLADAQKCFAGFFGREYFERSIELSGGRDLGAKVEFARNYARLLYDRELHDRLLEEVMLAEPVQPGLTLMNLLAQDQARDLLLAADDYF